MTSNTFSVCWWNPPQGPRNFGDALTPRLLEALSGRKVVHAPTHRAEIVSIGSVLEPCFWPAGSCEKWDGVIWGSGRLEAKRPIAFPKATVAALRGPLTRESVESPGAATAALGDPGLLADRLIERRPARWGLGLFPHFTHLRHPTIARLASPRAVCLIDPLDDPQVVMEKAASCEAIAASALHGLILADALGLRRIWIDPTPPGSSSHTRQTEFKFRDYFASIGEVPDGPRYVGETDSAKSLFDAATAASRVEVEARQRDLLAAFPFSRT